jgi:hypothetical protein
MRWNKDTIKSKKFQRWMGRAVLLMLVVLFGVKLLIGRCELWLCGLFVVTVVGYFILSDLKQENKS